MASTNAFRKGDLVTSEDFDSTVMVTKVEDSGRFSGVVIRTTNARYRVGETRIDWWDYEWVLSAPVVIPSNKLAVGDFVQVCADLKSPQKTIVLITDMLDGDADFAGVVVWDTNPNNIGYDGQSYHLNTWERTTYDVTLANRYPGVGDILNHSSGDFEVVVTKVESIYFDGVRISGASSGLPITGQEFHAYTLVRSK